LSSIRVDGFHIDEENTEEFWAHGLTADDVLQVLEGPHRIKRNRNARRASHLVVGRNLQGRCIAIPIEPTLDPTIWRPVTAWCPDTNHQLAWCP
jgi:hypothetical protein